MPYIPIGTISFHLNDPILRQIMAKDTHLYYLDSPDKKGSRDF